MLQVTFLEDRKSEKEYRQDARNHWAWIRLLLSDINVTYSEAIKMDSDEVYMLNAALDIADEQRKKKMEETKN